MQTIVIGGQRFNINSRPSALLISPELILGQGRDAIVVEGKLYDTSKSNATNISVAIKIPKRNDPLTDSLNILALRKEAAFLVACEESPYIINAFEYLSNAYVTMLPLELMDSSLAGLITKKRQLSAVTKIKISLDIASALDYLKQNGIIHRDIKAENILIKFTASTTIAKLADFGFATYASDTESFEHRMGTPKCMAPELLGSRTQGIFPYSYQSDIYAFAIVLWESVKWRLAYKDIKVTADTVIANIPKLTCDGKSTPITTDDIPVDMRAFMTTLEPLITACWDEVPEKRLSPDNVIAVLSSLLNASAGPSTVISRYGSAMYASSKSAASLENAPLLGVPKRNNTACKGCFIL